MNLRYTINMIIALTILSGCTICRTRDSDEFDEFIDTEYIGGGDNLCESDYVYSCDSEVYGLEMVGL